MNMPFSAFLKSTRAVFDIAILDPPYNYKIIQKALPHLVEKMSENGVIICEHEKECVLPHDIGRYEIGAAAFPHVGDYLPTEADR